MKNFIRSNLILSFTVTISLAIFTLLFYFFIKISNTNDGLINDHSDLLSEISEIEAKINELSFLNIDFELATAELSNLADREKKLTNILNTILNSKENLSLNWKNKGTESVNASLIRKFSRWRRNCESSGIILPGNSSNSSSQFFPTDGSTADENFGFSFGSYDGSWPSFSEAEANLLCVQSEIITEIIDIICDSADDNHSISITSLKRQSVGEVDQQNISTDELDVKNLNCYFLSDLSGVKSFIFEINLSCQTFSLRKLINKIKPPFLVRQLEVSPFEEVVAFNNDQFNSTPDPFGGSTETVNEDKFLPVVSQVNSKVVLVLEYVTEIKRNILDLHSISQLADGNSKEILVSWLKDSGNGSLISLTEKLIDETPPN